MLAALPGCNSKAPQDEGIPPPSGETVPCFPEWGPVAFVVDGVPVPEATVDRFAAFYKEQGVPGDDKAKARAIEEAIIGTASVYADARDQGKLAEWSRRVRAAEARLAGGEDFSEVARAASDCATKAAGGDLGKPFRRDENVAALTEAGFRTPVGKVTPPVVTVYGAHFLKVTGTIDGSSPARDQRMGAHILVAFDPKAIEDPAAYRETVQKLKKDAYVERVKEPYKKLIPTAYRK
jgi:hypothetical protein